ncbi:hypothetical protein VTK26DRAFT_7165 [Humicola hyalothermophila]
MYMCLCGAPWGASPPCGGSYLALQPASPPFSSSFLTINSSRNYRHGLLNLLLTPARTTRKQPPIPTHNRSPFTHRAIQQRHNSLTKPKNPTPYSSVVRSNRRHRHSSLPPQPLPPTPTPSPPQQQQQQQQRRRRRPSPWPSPSPTQPPPPRSAPARPASPASSAAAAATVAGLLSSLSRCATPARSRPRHSDHSHQ